MTLAEHLREDWATSRGVLQRQLSALDRGELAGAFTNEQLTIMRNAFQSGIAIYDRLLRLGMVELMVEARRVGEELGYACPLSRGRC